MRPVETQTAEIRALLNRRDAAVFLGVSVYTLDRVVKTGNLKPITVTRNGPFMFRVRDLNDFIEQRARARRPKPQLRGNVFGGVR